jgi:hypothetical protein
MSIHEDSEACLGCGKLVLVSAFMRPMGSDWQALLNLPPSVVKICVQCKNKVATRKRSARKRMEEGRPVSQEEAAVEPAVHREAGWGLSANTRRCVHLSPMRCLMML